MKIMFVCHGNICRSPLAEFLFNDKMKELKKDKEYIAYSKATSSEELGNPVYPPMCKILDRMGIDYKDKRAEKLVREDYNDYDYFIGMDDRNVVNMLKIFGQDKDKKIFKLMDFTDKRKDVEDPWWTGNFEETFTDVAYGINALIKFLKIK